MNNVKIQRQSNFEILRIISMFLIVLSHSVIHGNFKGESNLVFNNYILLAIPLGAKIGVNCFVLISGYFMVDKPIKYNKLYKLILQIFMYSFLFCVVLIGIGKLPFSFKLLVKSALPIITTQYWFATNYVLLYILTPYLQLLVKMMSKKQHFDLIVILLVIWSVLPTLLLGDPGYSNLGWFICMWLTAAYIKLYYDDFRKINIWYGITCFIGIIILTQFTYYLGKSSIYIQENIVYLYADLNKIPTVICSIVLFMGFKNLRIQNISIINIVSACTFGVYLIHDNRLLRPIIWNEIFKNINYIDSPWLVVRILFSVIIVFVGCALIEFFRSKIFDNIIRRKIWQS